MLDLPPLPTELQPAPGFALSGLVYEDYKLRPVFSRVGADTRPLDPAEMRLLRLLLSEKWGDRYQALRELGEDYMPNLEPALRPFFGEQHDSLIADRATHLLAFHGSDETIAALCDEIQQLSGVRLKRSIEGLRHRPTSAVITAMCRSMRSSGFGEKEGRDEDMVVGKALATMGSTGVEFLTALLSSPDQSMQVAGAVSLAAVRNPAALPVLLCHADGQDSILRRESLTALGAFPDHAEALAPLRRALAEHDLSFIALSALRTMGGAALPVLAPYADVDYFNRSGIERRGRNPFLPGVAYGEIVETILSCGGSLPEPRGPSNAATPDIRKTIASAGIVKLIVDLDSIQLRPGALVALIALGDMVHPYIPVLVTNMSARELLLGYPTKVILDQCSDFLSGETTNTVTDATCEVLGQNIRVLLDPARRRQSLEQITCAYPDAPWLRRLTGFVWREDSDSAWVTAALGAVPASASARRILDECTAAGQLGINVPLRWSEENLAEIIRNRNLAAFDGRPIAALVYAEADYNGAFSQHNSIVAGLILAGYCVRYYDESTDIGVLRAIAAAVTCPDSATIEPAAILILGAHSNQTEMRFGRSEDAAAILSLEDGNLVAQSLIGETVRKDGHVILVACNAGEGREKKDNLANMFGGIFKHAAVWSTEVPDNLQTIVLNTEGVITDVKFHHGKVYRR